MFKKTISVLFVLLTGLHVYAGRPKKRTQTTERPGKIVKTSAKQTDRSKGKVSLLTDYDMIAQFFADDTSQEDSLDTSAQSSASAALVAETSIEDGSTTLTEDASSSVQGSAALTADGSSSAQAAEYSALPAERVNNFVRWVQSGGESMNDEDFLEKLTAVFTILGTCGPNSDLTDTNKIKLEEYAERMLVTHYQLMKKIEEDLNLGQRLSSKARNIIVGHLIQKNAHELKPLFLKLTTAESVELCKVSLTQLALIINMYKAPLSELNAYLGDKDCMTLLQTIPDSGLREKICTHFGI